MSEERPRRPLVPAFLLGRFADGTGRVLMERRDRGRRRMAVVEEAVLEAGSYTVVRTDDESRDLTRVLARIDEWAAIIIERMTTGVFPPRGEDRAHVASFIAFALLLGRGPRAALAQTVDALAQLILSNLPDADEPSEAAAAEPGVTAEPEATAEPARVDVVMHDDVPRGLALSGAPELARLLYGRTWQLVRFARPQLLTGDSPVALWNRPRSVKPYALGLGAADEARFPLDPRHALVVARHAPAGEVIRDLGDRHAAALNRTMAEAARQWIFYHPDSDPLEGVELALP